MKEQPRPPITKAQRRRRYLALVIALGTLDGLTGLTLLDMPPGPPRDVTAAVWGLATMLLLIGTAVLGFTATTRK